MICVNVVSVFLRWINSMSMMIDIHLQGNYRWLIYIYQEIVGATTAAPSVSPPMTLVAVTFTQVFQIQTQYVADFQVNQLQVSKQRCKRLFLRLYWVLLLVHVMILFATIIIFIAVYLIINSSILFNNLTWKTEFYYDRIQ